MVKQFKKLPSWHRENSSQAGVIARGGMISIAGRLAQSVVMFLGTIALARILAPSDFGILAPSIALFLLVHTILEGLLEYPMLREVNLGEEQIRSLLWIGFAVAGMIGLVVFAAADFLEIFFGFAGLENVIRVMAPFYFLLPLIICGRALLRRQHRFYQVSRITLISAVIYVAVSVSLAHQGFGLWSMVAGQVASFSAMAIQFKKASRLTLRPPRRLRFTTLGRPARLGALSRLLAWFWSQIDTVIVSLMFSAATTGLYVRAYGLSVQVKEPFAAVDHPIRQFLIKSAACDEPIGDMAQVMLRHLTIASASIAGYLIVLRESAVALLLGPQWSDAAIPLAILLAGLPARVARQFVDSLSLATGAMQHMVFQHGILCLTVGLGVALAAQFGIIAVATAVSLSMYTALVAPVVSFNSRNSKSNAQILAAMLPGLAMAILFVFICELLRYTAPTSKPESSRGL